LGTKHMTETKEEGKVKWKVDGQNECTCMYNLHNRAGIK
jgi:hypothetical protein